MTGLGLPGGRVAAFSYDENGNVESITPPGRDAHSFGFTAADLMDRYTPPMVGTGPSTSTFLHNLDKDLTRISRPGGAEIELCARKRYRSEL